MTNKKLQAMSDITRAIGILEGVSYSVSKNASAAIVDAVQIIEESLKELVGDG